MRQRRPLPAWLVAPDDLAAAHRASVQAMAEHATACLAAVASLKNFTADQTALRPERAQQPA